MRRPIITILTDFGTKDHYVASMKGVILGIDPRCHLVDISHEVSPHDIEEGAFILLNVYSCFPKGTIHLAVVDPGVGGPRKPLLIATENYFFIGADNGLFSFVLRKEKVKQTIALTNERYFLPSLTSTFHGRDLFAPVAGHLSLGVEPKAFGKAVDKWKTLRFRDPVENRGKLTGEVFHVDAFGNLISNIGEKQLSRFAENYPIVVKAGHATVHGLRKGYWEGKKGEAIALIGSGGFLELSIREGNASRRLRVEKGDPVEVISVRP